MGTGTFRLGGRSSWGDGTGKSGVVDGWSLICTFAGVDMKGNGLTIGVARYNVVGGTCGLGGFRSVDGGVRLVGVDLWEPPGVMDLGGVVGSLEGPLFVLEAFGLGIDGVSLDGG